MRGGWSHHLGRGYGNSGSEKRESGTERGKGALDFGGSLLGQSG